MKSLYLKIAFILLMAWPISCFAQKYGQKTKPTFSVMTYNLENFFDTKHDTYIGNHGEVVHKNDYAYLPLSFKQGMGRELIEKACSKIPYFPYGKDCYNQDWNKKVAVIKLKNMIKAMMFNPKTGCGADIMVVQEIENKNVLKAIFDHLPKSCGYKAFGLIEGPDRRGIDIGVISRFNIYSHRLIDYPLQPNDKKRRGIYEINLKIFGKKVTIFGNHWPSLGTKDTEVRFIAARLLTKAVRASQSDLIIAVGDFNSSMKKEPTLFTYLRRTFTDALIQGVKPNMPGSHAYRGHWDFIDRVFVAKKSLKSSVKTFQPIWNSLYVVNKGLVWDRDIRSPKTGRVKYKKGTPMRFSSYWANKTGVTGYSDHLPVVLYFQML